MKKIWLITGVSSGLGKAIARAAMREGNFVIGTVRNERDAEAFNSAHDGSGHAHVLDISNEEAVAALVNRIQSKFKTIDVLVNNAGIGFTGAIEETSLAEARHIMNVNFFGILQVTQAVLPLMREAKRGHIIQISSHGGVKAFAGFGIYNASKFGMEGMSEALAQEVQPLGIRLSIVEPGPFRTKFAGRSLQEAAQRIADYDDTAGIFRTRLRGVDGKQEGDPEKAAQAIVNLSKQSNPPLRLPLGKTALATISSKLQSVQVDLEAARAIAENVVFSN
jgi:NAD(P)-dependent dehydrogenase (short-subunit alcohol dehydrogenase family)